MSETICPDCGERNVGRVEFCAACGAFLAWDGPAETADVPPPATGPVVATARPAAGSAAPPAASSAPPRQTVSGYPPAGATPVAGPAAGTRPSPAQQQPMTGGTFGAPPTARPAPATMPAAPPPPPPPDAPCPRCGVTNNPALRFCRKCGLALQGPVLHDAPAPRAPATAERVPWWRRWFGSGTGNTRRAARAAYRHSLPVRYRVLRWVMALAGVAAVVGLLAVLGRNPVGWVTDRIEDLRGDLVQVSGITAYAEPVAGASPAGGPTADAGAAGQTGDPVPVGTTPSGSVVPSGAAVPSTAAGPGADGPGAQGAAPNLLDNLADTAWTTPWSAEVRQVAAQGQCVPPGTITGLGAPGSVVLVPPQPVAVRQLSIAAGLGKDDIRRPQQWRPKTIQLAYSDGRCQQFVLTDVDGLQQVAVEPVDSAQIRLSVVDAYPPLSDQPTDELAITDIRLFQRP